MKNYNLDELVNNYDLYEFYKDVLKDYVIENISLRKEIVTVVVHGEEILMPLGTALLNMILLKPFVSNHIDIDKEDLFISETVTQKSLEIFFNRMINKSTINSDLYDKIREEVAEVLDEASDFGSMLTVRKGNTVSYRDFIRIAVDDPESAKELFNPQITISSFDSIEDQFSQHGKKLVEYFKNHKESELHPFVSSGTGINGKQLTQCIGFVGLKPDMDGSVIPVVVKENFLNGLNSLESYYIGSKGTRKALITNKSMTKKSGYLNRKLSLSNIDRYHDNSILDCGTRHFVKYNVENEKKLVQILDRHYYDLDEAGQKASELKTVTKDSDIIGKTIALRSPVTCCGKHVCATCYGRRLSEINKDVNTGLVAVNTITEPLTQRLLSAKHLLSTRTDKIDWGTDFYEVFSINMDSVYFEDTEVNITFRKPTLEEFDEDEDKYWTEELDIQYVGTKKPIHYKSPVKLFINPKLLTVEKMKDDDDDITISSKSINEDMFVFKYQAKNNELTKSLQQILDLIESNDHGIKDYHGFVNKFNDLLIENDMNNIRSVHTEMVSSVLIRDAETGKMLDFKKEQLDSYKICRVSKSVLLSPLGVSLAFERLGDQFIDLSTYEKDEDSLMDYLYR